MERQTRLDAIHSKVKQNKWLSRLAILKKEFIGDFFCAGYLYTRETIRTLDHDFNSLAKGIVIPHGIYDMARHTGYINIGTSKDTSESALKFASRIIRHIRQNITRLNIVCFRM